MLKIEVFSHFHQIELLGVPDVVRNILEHLQSHLLIRILHNYPNNQPNYPNNQPKYSKMRQKSGFLTISFDFECLNMLDSVDCDGTKWF